MKVRASSVAALNVLHIIPRFVGGGPERSLLAFAAYERVAGTANRHVVAVLEPPVAPHMFLACAAARRRTRNSPRTAGTRAADRRRRSCCRYTSGTIPR